MVMRRRRMIMGSSLCPVGEGMVASGGEDGAVRVWSTKDGQLPHEMRRGAAEGAEGAAVVMIRRRMMVGSLRFAQSVRAWLRVADMTERSVCGARRTATAAEMRRGAAEGAEGGSGGGDDKAAHDGGVRSLCSVGRAWLRVAE